MAEYNEEFEGLATESDRFIKYIVRVNHPKKTIPYRESIYLVPEAMTTDTKKEKNKKKNKKTKFLGL